MENLFDSTIERYRSEGRIEFITFHPAYSYEEFIEGITVKTDTGSVESDSNDIQYIRKWGIFKKICTSALANAINVDLDSEKESWEDQWKSTYEKYKERIAGRSKEDINKDVWDNTSKYIWFFSRLVGKGLNDL